MAFEALVARKTPAVAGGGAPHRRRPRGRPGRRADGLPARLGAARALRRDLLLQHLALPDRDEPRRSTSCGAPARASAPTARRCTSSASARSRRSSRRRARPRTASWRASSSSVSHRLSAKQKAAFVLREMQDCDTREIAEILQCGESTVRNHLFNARRILRREIERLHPGLFGAGAEVVSALLRAGARRACRRYGRESCSAADRRAVREHLAGCAACRAEAAAADPVLLFSATAGRGGLLRPRSRRSSRRCAPAIALRQAERRIEGPSRPAELAAGGGGRCGRPPRPRCVASDARRAVGAAVSGRRRRARREPSTGAPPGGAVRRRRARGRREGVGRSDRLRLESGRGRAARGLDRGWLARHLDARASRARPPRVFGAGSATRLPQEFLTE